MFLKVLERITGRKSIRPGVDAVTTGKTWLSELRQLARRSRQATRKPVELIPGKKIEVFMTGDINPDTGKLYPDYKERRKKSTGVEVGDWDIYPD